MKPAEEIQVNDSIITDHSNHAVGTYIDRTLKIIRWNYLQAFKAAGVDITTEQWVVLDQLSLKPGISQTGLANETFKNTATLSRIIDLLCQKGLIKRQRQDHDRRQYELFITKSGESIVNKLRPIVFELRRKGWTNISQNDYKHFIRIIDQIYTNFELEVLSDPS